MLKILPAIKAQIYLPITFSVSYPSDTILLALVKATKNPNPKSTIKIINNFQSSFGLCILFNFFPISSAFPICTIAFSSASSSCIPSSI